MSANDEQVGGKHYAAEYQHWDWCVDCRLGYLESAATKYVSRHARKNGAEDLLKARHYVNKAEEAWREGRYQNFAIRDLDKTNRFLAASEVDPNDYPVFFSLLRWRVGDELRDVSAFIADRAAALYGAAHGQGAAPLVGYGGTPKAGACAPAALGACGWCAAPLPLAAGRCGECGSMQHPFGFMPEEER